MGLSSQELRRFQAEMPRPLQLDGLVVLSPLPGARASCWSQESKGVLLTQGLSQPTEPALDSGSTLGWLAGSLSFSLHTTALISFACN